MEGLNDHPMRDVEPGHFIEMRMLASRHAVRNGKSFIVDIGWPNRMEAEADFNGVDEGTAALLYGLVRALQPAVCLETGTHKGRSTQAIAAALVKNRTSGPGRLWTLDLVDFNVRTSGALSPEELSLTTFNIGKSPECLSAMLASEENKIGIPGPIDFAYIDGGHEYDVCLAELEFVRKHAAKECVLAVDNTQDGMWEGVAVAIEEFSAGESVRLSTMCGLDILKVES